MLIREDDRLLMALDAADLEILLGLPPHYRLAEIVKLNRTPRYANQLNAFMLLDRLAEISRLEPQVSVRRTAR